MKIKRSNWKVPYISGFSWKQVNRKITKTFKRLCSVNPRLIGKTISIYNGQTFVKIQIKKEMLGLKLGELSISKVLGFMQKKTKKHQPKSKS